MNSRLHSCGAVPEASSLRLSFPRSRRGIPVVLPRRPCGAVLLRSPAESPLGLASICNSFRINTCESVLKQRTLSIFRINTYEKTGEGGVLRFPSCRHSLILPFQGLLVGEDRHAAAPYLPFSHQSRITSHFCWSHCAGPRSVPQWPL